MITRIRFFVNKKYYSTASIFRIIRNGDNIRIVVRVRVDERNKALRLDGAVIEVLNWRIGDPSRYEPDDVVLTLRNLKERRAWISFGIPQYHDEILYSYIECWTDNWEGNLI